MESSLANPVQTRRADLPDPARVTAARVRLAAARERVTDWAARHGEEAASVYKVLSGRRACVSGDAQRIAVKLGIVDPPARATAHA